MQVRDRHRSVKGVTLGHGTSQCRCHVASVHHRIDRSCRALLNNAVAVSDGKQAVSAGGVTVHQGHAQVRRGMAGVLDQGSRWVDEAASVIKAVVDPAGKRAVIGAVPVNSKEQWHNM